MGLRTASKRRLAHCALLLAVGCASTRSGVIDDPDPLVRWLRASATAREIGRAAAANGWMAEAPGAVEELRAAMIATDTASVDALEATLGPVVGNAANLLAALRLRRPGATRGDLAHWAAVALIALGDGEPDATALTDLRHWDAEYLAQVLDLREVARRGNLAAAARPTALETDPAPPDLLLDSRGQWWEALVARADLLGWPAFARPGSKAVIGVLPLSAGEALHHGDTRWAVARPGIVRAVADWSATVAVYRVEPGGGLDFFESRVLALRADDQLEILAADERGRRQLWIWLGDGLVARVARACCQVVEEPQGTWWAQLRGGDQDGRWTMVGPDDFESVPWNEYFERSQTRSRTIPGRLGSLGVTDHPQIAGARLLLWREGQGPPLFVLHGGPGFGSRYLREPLVATLGSERQLVMFDQRGSGYSDGADDPDGLTMRRLVDDIEVLRERAGLEQIDLLGHSFGGLLALHYALAYPEHVGAMVLVEPDPASRADWDRFREVVDARVRPADAAQIAGITEIPGWNNVPEAMTAWFGLRLRAYTADPEVADRIDLTFDEIVLRNQQTTYPAIRADLGDWDLYSRLAEIRAPTLIVAGDSSIFPAATFTAMHDALPASELQQVEHAGHFPFIENPDRFARVVLEFLRRVSPAPSTPPDGAPE